MPRTARKLFNMSSVKFSEMTHSVGGKSSTYFLRVYTGMVVVKRGLIPLTKAGRYILCWKFTSSAGGMRSGEGSNLEGVGNHTVV